MGLTEIYILRVQTNLKMRKSVLNVKFVCAETRVKTFSLFIHKLCVLLAADLFLYIHNNRIVLAL